MQSLFLKMEPWATSTLWDAEGTGHTTEPYPLTNTVLAQSQTFLRDAAPILPITTTPPTPRLAFPSYIYSNAPQDLSSWNETQHIQMSLKEKSD